MENNTAKIDAGILMATGILINLPMRKASRIPVMTPRIPPMEVNTTASKASDTEVVDCVIIIKTELEKIREQVQNIE